MKYMKQQLKSKTPQETILFLGKINLSTRRVHVIIKNISTF